MSHIKAYEFLIKQSSLLAGWISVSFWIFNKFEDSGSLSNTEHQQHTLYEQGGKVSLVLSWPLLHSGACLYSIIGNVLPNSASSSASKSESLVVSRRRGGGGVASGGRKEGRANDLATDKFVITFVFIYELTLPVKVKSTLKYSAMPIQIVCSSSVSIHNFITKAHVKYKDGTGQQI